MQDRFISSMHDFGFPQSGKTILVAVSGGVDSMVLASLLYQSGYSIGIAHCNYQLRGADSDADELLVKTWCAKRGIPFHLKKVETQKIVNETSSSVQMVARTERYAFFNQLIEENDYEVVALAHHANDRVESLLLNILRGTGIRGLLGMPSKRERIIRPLLGFLKTEVLAFAKAQNIAFRNDASNLETYYQRNWVRLRLIPMLNQVDAASVEKLVRFSERVENELPNYEKWVEQKLLESDFETNGLSVEWLKKNNARFTLLKEILKPIGFSSDQVFEVMDLIHSSSGTQVCSATHCVVKDRDRLLFSECETVLKPPKLNFEILSTSKLKSLKVDSQTALIDVDLVAIKNVEINSILDLPELELRLWKEGDRFKPLGMNGWKKLSDFFIDQKLSIIEKQRTWLLTFKDEIVWVIGMRLDNRFKITEATKNVLKVSILKSPDMG